LDLPSSLPFPSLLSSSTYVFSSYLYIKLYFPSLETSDMEAKAEVEAEAFGSSHFLVVEEAEW
jgi:hypothetical protein